MTDMLAARDLMLSELRAELVGPTARGKEIDCDQPLEFPDYEAANGPFKQAANGEEILTVDLPVKRYGIGVLYPYAAPDESGAAAETTESEEVLLDVIADENDEEAEPEAAIAPRKRTESPDDDLPLSTANNLRPSSFGLSFVADVSGSAELIVELTGGRYAAKDVRIKDRDNKLVWWLREPVQLTAVFTREQLMSRRAMISPATLTGEQPNGMTLDITAMTRPTDDSRTLVTVTVVNRTPASKNTSGTSLFQAAIRCTPTGADAAVLPYEERGRASTDEELKSLSLLYRDVPAFAVGHGCAADWETAEGASSASCVMSASLPAVEVPSTTPDIADADGSVIKVPMRPLAGLDADDDGAASLQAIVDGYSAWIDKQATRVPSLSPGHQDAAGDHLEACRHARDRMQDGIAFLASDTRARRAFALANHAMMLQQQRSGHPARPTTFDRDRMRVVVDGEFRPAIAGRGNWRPFQIAFVLASLRSTVEKSDSDRGTVELIFFPTGGGKTEAYLALTAYSIFYRRLVNPADSGVDVIMRYTLRLLTAQQFQRASSLICAMEILRAKDHARLGTDEISIGVWLGGSVTPNSRKVALAALKQMNREGAGAENPFVLLRCPWCSAQMGAIEATGKGQGRRAGATPKVAGYVSREDTVALRCPDTSCEFSRSLPIYVIDDDVYERKPSLVIGTVDKFAMLAFRPQARAIFGIGDDGGRVLSPPNLIIQDELHLISGPLGSMVGLYETLIEELCTDHRDGAAAKPKIVGSTATIRRFQQQIRDLYGRSSAALFPPRGLDAGDSYFAQYARHDDGTLMPGRTYVGVHGPGLGSIQTAQVRTFATLLQTAFSLPEDAQDPFWTLLVFFNSLRELGTSVSLLQSDIPDYLGVIRKRNGLASEQVRRVWRPEELTGRLRNDEVPAAIEKLEVPRTKDGPPAVDVCLASNIVEVGIDIDRLSLMTVVGQPKTTAQYIQATGRIGRRWWERPGLVTTIYGASKPRDRSHFERFRSYHERLYAQVEPTSVTPFAPPVLDRALHAVMVAYVRQLGALKATPRPVPDDLLRSVYDLLEARVRSIDPEELGRFEAKFRQRLHQWERWQYTEWETDHESEDYALLRYAGSYADREAQQLTWAIPTSLRNVDAECRAIVSKAYIKDEDAPAEPAEVHP